MLVNRYLKRILLLGTGTLLAIALAACDSGNSTPTTISQPTTAAIVATATVAAPLSTSTVAMPVSTVTLPTAASTANATVEGMPSAVGTFAPPVLTTEPQLTATP